MRIWLVLNKWKNNYPPLRYYNTVTSDLNFKFATDIPTDKGLTQERPLSLTIFNIYVDSVSGI